MQRRYRVLFEGKIQDGRDLAVVKEALARNFRTDAARIEGLFRKSVVVMAKDVDHATAQRYLKLFDNAGACCVLEPLGVASPVASPAAAASPPARAPAAVDRKRATRQMPMPSERREPLKASPRQNVVAVFLLVGIIAAVGGRLWSSLAAQDIEGPRYLSAAAGRVFGDLDRNLFVLSEDGDTLDLITLETLGIAGPLAGLQALDADAFLVGDVATESIYRCGWHPAGCTRISPPPGETLSLPFKFYLDQDRDLLYITEADRHSLRVHDLTTDVVRELADGKILRFPNQVGLLPDGQLYIADTNHNRVAAFSPQKYSVEEAGFEITARTPFSRTLRWWPFAFEQGPAGHWWVLNAADGMTKADLIEYAAGGEPLRRVDLGEGSEPESITSADGLLIVADSALFDIHAVDPETGGQRSFGSGELREKLDSLKVRKARYQTTGAVSLGALGLFVIGAVGLAIAVAATRGKSKKAVPAEVAPLAGGRVAASDASAVVPAEDAREEGRELTLTFSGSPKEYFRIWIVNLCLSLLTLGIFSAWAKVRKKRYFYSHLALDGTPFQYLARPLPILKGRLIAAMLFALYYSSSHLFTALLPYVLGVGLIIAPWALARSAAFNARYSAYRNMTFRFEGTYLQAFKVLYAWGIVPAMVAGTMFNWWGNPLYAILPYGIFGLYSAWWMRGIKHFVVVNSSFGGRNGDFGATGSEFFSVYFVGGLIVTAFAVVAGVTTAAAAAVVDDPQMLMYMLVPFYAGYVLGYAYTQANLTNRIWNKIRLGPVRFRSTLETKDLLKLYLTNALGIVVSLGLLIPWAVIRTLRYRAERTGVRLMGDLGEFSGSGEGTVQAVGAELTEFFDMDLSL